MYVNHCVFGFSLVHNHTLCNQSGLECSDSITKNSRKVIWIHSMAKDMNLQNFRNVLYGSLFIII